jgi:hypothetical protein
MLNCGARRPHKSPVAEHSRKSNDRLLISFSVEGKCCYVELDAFLLPCLGSDGRMFLEESTGKEEEKKRPRDLRCSHGWSRAEVVFVRAWGTTTGSSSANAPEQAPLLSKIVGQLM